MKELENYSLDQKSHAFLELIGQAPLLKWTPSVGGTATYTNQSGFLVKIGRLAYAEARMTINTIGTGSTTTISGFPLAAVAFSLFNLSTTGLATSVVSISGEIAPGATSMDMIGRTAAATGESLITSFQNGTDIILSGFYLV